MPQRARTSAVHDMSATQVAETYSGPPVSLPAANDNQPARRARSKNPRHRALQDVLRPLLAWRALREAAEADPVQSTWMASSAATLDVDADEADVVGNEGADRDALPKDPKRLERALLNMLKGVVFEEREEAIVRRLSAEDAVRRERAGADIRRGSVDGEDRAIEIVERRTRVVIIGGDIERSKYSGRLVRAGCLRFADALRGADALSTPDNDDEPVVDVMPVDSFIPEHEDFHVPDDADIEARLAPAHEPDVEQDGGYNNLTPAGSLLGIEHVFAESGDKVVVPLKTKLRFTERTSPRPPLREVLSIEDIRRAQDTLRQLIELLPSHVVAILDENRAKNFKEIGEFAGKRGKHAERVGKASLISACTALAAALETVDLLSAA